MKRSLALTLGLAALSASSGCSLLIGNIKPVDQKSESYQIRDLSKDKVDWVKLDSRKPDAGASASPDTDGAEEASDLTFQSRATSSIISLNSACRDSLLAEKADLRNFTNELLFGLSGGEDRAEEEIVIDGVKALQTTVSGRMNGQSMKLRTVVLHYSKCLYDLMYIARPGNFDQQTADFSSFASSLKVK